ncbi:ABC transporter ATP-binding protein [Flavobacterium agricola]|uniref:ABC transporter ATP-binding protein n=1 Tax=Flavobacterium agricola TaxID=2870839 RepID=A0ABY6M3H4_9FLAO|nr:ABC transporter ATP-binding protein [Flavobacterium agricola]UYW02304.1 ABC transporter ATP-binding protein [Flavobacterium agricola]
MTEPRFIEISDLTFSYGSKTLLRDVNVHFHKHAFSVILGINGSGKSTLFKLISGIVKHKQGQITWEDEPIQNFKGKERAKRLGYLPQFYQSIFPYSVEQVMLTGRAAFNRFAPKASDYEKVIQILTDLELLHLKDQDFTTLSGGQQQLIMIGRLLMQDPELLLLDEPTNHLDVYFQHHLMKKLSQYVAKGLTVIAVMHDPTLAYQYANHFYFMLNHKIVSTYNHEPDSELLEKVYGIPFIQVQQNQHEIVLPKRL